MKKNIIVSLLLGFRYHAHEDHVGGLSGALSVVIVNNKYSPCGKCFISFSGYNPEKYEQNAEEKA